MKKKIALTGATGSIGKSALDVLAQAKDLFEVTLLSAHKNSEDLAEAARLWPGAQTVLSGEKGGKERLLAAIADCGADLLLNGICGAAGLEPSLAAIEAGSNLALANKETLVMAGPIVLKHAKEKNVKIIPVDSEHSAVFHLLEAHASNRVGDHVGDHADNFLEEIILTASGGPFRNFTLKEMENITPQAALAHPTWNMGAKITVDSATMANKGLEIIEAARLFDLPPEKIKVTVHPQSIVHSMIRMKNGSLYAQLSRPDMRLPIQDALYWPEKGRTEFGRLEFDSLSLEFFPPDTDKFPLTALAYEAVKKGGLYPCAYNGANEAAVQAFLEERIGFLEIGRITMYVLEKDWSAEPENIEAVIGADMQSKMLAEKIIKEIKW